MFSLFIVVMIIVILFLLIISCIYVQREQDKDKSSFKNSFYPTRNFSNIAFDDNSRKVWISGGMIFNYNQIVDFELIEKNNAGTFVRGGLSLGGAVVGGLLFGGAGAVIGGLSGKKKVESTCDFLRIKITLRDCNRPTVFVNFINSRTEICSFSYERSFKQAQEVLSCLQLAVEMVRGEAFDNNIQHFNNYISSGADEILKYKKLYDEGIITLEEFNKKKDEILNNK